MTPITTPATLPARRLALSSRLATRPHASTGHVSSMRLASTFRDDAMLVLSSPAQSTTLNVSARRESGRHAPTTQAALDSCPLRPVSTIPDLPNPFPTLRPTQPAPNQTAPTDYTSQIIPRPARSCRRASSSHDAARQRSTTSLTPPARAWIAQDRTTQFDETTQCQIAHERIAVRTGHPASCGNWRTTRVGDGD